MTLTNRRETLLALAFATLAASNAAAQTGASSMTEAELAQHAHDWDWLAGTWNVRHRRLKDRLANCTEWDEFNGTCHMVPTLAGLGNMDDNWLDLPSGAYRAMGIRAFNPETREWSIWWLDARVQTIDPPVRGGFSNGVGVFQGADTFRNQPIIVRFMWSEITANTARWEQTFSPDNGATWEVNWVMHFARA